MLALLEVGRRREASRGRTPQKQLVRYLRVKSLGCAKMQPDQVEKKCLW